MRPSGDVRDDGDGCDGARGDAPADRDGDRPPEAGRSYSCPPTQSTVSSSHSAAPKLNKSRRDVRPREGMRRPCSSTPLYAHGIQAGRICASHGGDRTWARAKRTRRYPRPLHGALIATQ